ncbi:undecaprenyl-phosphate glucose phosphotransferase [Paraburkholderia sp. SOS3]|jgi:putative colanic acid biosynthesis UDP-glucose lipid carrier transferase|uniref:undecaprenyl-phosphate glucose phosphotransferase n=1 Tax=Paraburkholderia sp. SOS3 TaxID=1926494 RepID=UPI00094735B5|nr:undecaprenyl-phosphate glucose phosphotransferase [Paraburkholderia sp. SOS3]APR39504.1 undecaprenyl-phosphate glucose phosphotransferase [Paraburkholderia sp. SOS3]
MFSLALQIGDLLMIVAGALFALSCTYSDATTSHLDDLFGLLGVLLALLAFHLIGVYRSSDSNGAAARSTTRAMCGWLAAQLAIALISSAYPGAAQRMNWILGWTAFSAALMLLHRYTLYTALRALRSRGYGRTPVAIVARAEHGRAIATRLATNQDTAYTPELIFDTALERDTLVADIPTVCQLESFAQLVRAHRIGELWIVDARDEPACVEQIVDAFRDDFVNIRIVPALEGRLLPEPAIVDCLGVPVLNVIASPERGLRVLPKAIFDRLFALCALLGLAPVLALIALAVKCSSPGPVFFRQSRKGMNGEVFSIYKFRTMYQDADRPGAVKQASRNDARITRVGRFLRGTSLDELPQFINVLKGEMSVVGPRPHAVEHDEYYKHLVQDYMYRYRIKPGITGWAQVNGYRGETERVEKMAARVMFDIHYIQHWTMGLDLKIVWLTVLKGFVGSNAY